jgi:hypothetical protein
MIHISTLGYHIIRLDRKIPSESQTVIAALPSTTSKALNLTQARGTRSAHTSKHSPIATTVTSSPRHQHAQLQRLQLPATEAYAASDPHAVFQDKSPDDRGAGQMERC